MTPCVIDRSKWVRFVPEKGEIVGGIPMLENSRGNHCCLGFGMLALYPNENFRETGLPSDASISPNRLCLIEKDAVNLNDDPCPSSSSAEQEQSIANLFSTVGLQVTFIN